MTQTRQNGIVVPTNSDPYNLTADLAKAADSTNVLIPVTSQAVRDALTKHPGLTVVRLDLTGTPLETWDGSAWSLAPRLDIGAPTANRAITKAGFSSFATGTFGDFTWNFPVAFPNSMVSAFMQEASSINNNDYPVIIKVRMDQSDRTKIVGRCYRGDGTKFVGAINVTWSAYGW